MQQKFGTSHDKIRINDMAILINPGRMGIDYQCQKILATWHGFYMDCFSNLDPEDINLTTWHHANYLTDLLWRNLFHAKTRLIFYGFTVSKFVNFPRLLISKDFQCLLGYMVRYKFTVLALLISVFCSDRIYPYPSDLLQRHWKALQSSNSW